MEIKVWGARGSRPVSGPEFTFHGGDTTCLEVRLQSGKSILLDAGTGINTFDRKTSGRSCQPVLCLTHTHLDHIQGLPFFSGMYNSATPLEIFGPEFPDGAGLENSISRLFDGVLMPVSWETLPAPKIHPVKPGQTLEINGALLATCPTNHPGGCIAWKITADEWTFAFTGDHEIPLDNSNPDKTALHDQLMKFLDCTDIILADSHFSDDDLATHPGWGHSSYNQWQQALAGKRVGKLLFTHFNPSYNDNKVEALTVAAEGPIPSQAVYDQCLIRRDGIVEKTLPVTCPACDFSQRVAAFSDTHSILAALLGATRKLANADAGTVYLLENKDLVFAAAQNDSLFPNSAANKFAYMNTRLLIDGDSIAGYTARTGRLLNLPDVYNLPPDSEYKFNNNLDKTTGYRTKSMLAIPLVNGTGKIIGVLQLINAQRNNGPISFGREKVQAIAHLCHMATIPLERSFLIGEMILRILQTSALRDPAETAGHVRRVGSMAAELYHRWAEKAGVDPEELLAAKGQLRLAAMLHDIGKVGIPDAVLKKPGKLGAEERAIMEKHAFLGAGLFIDSIHEIDKMAKDIALHHHARWDGKGYTGNTAIQSPKGTEIPLWARITAIADVYDALVSDRSYKKGWPMEKALRVLQEEAGSHFDPELVTDFLEIKELVQSICACYNDAAGN